VTTIQRISEFLAGHAPPPLAEEWDNVGLLVGDPAREAQRVMTCLTVTPTSAAEAVRERADLIVTHHPLPFRPLKQLTTHSVVGKLLLQLISARIAVHSSHTAFDSAPDGINAGLAAGCGLTEIRPLVPSSELPALGAGRVGRLSPPTTLAAVAARIKSFLRIEGLHCVGDLGRTIGTVAVACGSAGQFLSAAREAGCDLLITGETTFHTCLEAEATNVALLLPGHFASERFGMERLAARLSTEFPDLLVWPSRDEADPLRWLTQA
jgi:dinuclear metal center YbgI/SA1388 family protein